MWLTGRARRLQAEAGWVVEAGVCRRPHSPAGHRPAASTSSHPRPSEATTAAVEEEGEEGPGCHSAVKRPDLHWPAT